MGENFELPERPSDVKSNIAFYCMEVKNVRLWSFTNTSFTTKSVHPLFSTFFFCVSRYRTHTNRSIMSFSNPISLFTFPIRFTKLYANKIQNFKSTVCNRWDHRSYFTSLYAKSHIWWNQNAVNEKKQLITAFKHSGVGMIMLTFFEVTGAGYIANIRRINSNMCVYISNSWNMS